MDTVSAILVAVSFVLCYLLPHEKSPRISPELSAFVDTHSLAGESEARKGYLLYSSIVFPVVSIACALLLSALPFIPYALLVVNTLVIHKFHSSDKDILLEETSDSFGLFIYAYFLFVIYALFRPSADANTVLRVLTPYLLVYCHPLISKISLLNGLFLHYRARAIESENKNHS